MINAQKTPMFELENHKPKHWPVYPTEEDESTTITGIENVVFTNIFKREASF